MKHIKIFELYHDESLNEGKFLRGISKLYLNVTSIIKNLPNTVK